MSMKHLRVLGMFVALVLTVSCQGEDSSDSADDDLPRWTQTWSAARYWNEALLVAIRTDLARPTVHARNLFHSSALMYDLWAVFDDSAETYFVGKTVGGFSCPFSDEDREILREGAERPDAERAVAISYAMRRFLIYRFQNSPGAATQMADFEDRFEVLGFDPDFESRDFDHGTRFQRAAALGLYAADCVVDYGNQDGANEAENYRNTVYEAVNAPLEPDKPGNPTIADPNRWQPLDLENSIDQAGNEVDNLQSFVGAEWGRVVPFALPEEAYVGFTRDDFLWPVCHDPGAPAELRGDNPMPYEYQWNHALVAYWSSHLDPTDGVMWDISPAHLGNTTALPEDIPSLEDFYDTLEGGVSDQGHAINPYTGEPYAPNIVPRGDYTRVLAEFWADGPQSETPPGHWFVIANEAVNDQPALVKKYRGEGAILSDLEWDAKLYFTLGGAVQDAAVTAWGIKGWYDSVRPISAIRFMAGLGQSSDDALDNYDPEGFPLVDGFSEVVEEGDPLAGDGDENIGKIKLLAWKGSRFIDDPTVDVAGVDWVLAENWVPYQRPTFVTPPFAGYVSGHSTFSRAAAEVLTAFTGDEFFPGGLAEFTAPKDEFLVFEDGPSVDVVLQWATYRDASDQTSLSRIWGGIHPPMDDIPGRRLGILIAADAMERADAYFQGDVSGP